MQELIAYTNGELVGSLKKLSNGAHSFQYDRSWINNDKARSLSLKLQLPEAIHQLKGKLPKDFPEHISDPIFENSIKMLKQIVIA